MELNIYDLILAILKNVSIFKIKIITILLHQR
jgi:hypothetical protein